MYLRRGTRTICDEVHPPSHLGLAVFLQNCHG